MTFENAEFFVQTLVRWADAHVKSIFVLHRGHRERGLLLLRQDLRGGLSRFWVQETGAEGQVQFRRRFAEDQTPEAAQAYVDRERARDEDLWVLILEDSDGTLPPVFQAVPSSEN